MKAKFEFNLPEENCEFQTYIKAGDYSSALYEVACALRKIHKYNDGLSEKECELIDNIYSEFWEICSAHNVDPFEG
jgi:hypothetical protein